MAHPRVAGGGDGLQIWRVDGNVVNKQLRTTSKWWSSRLVVGQGANNSWTQENGVLWNVTQSLGFGGS